MLSSHLAGGSLSSPVIETRSLALGPLLPAMYPAAYDIALSSAGAWPWAGDSMSGSFEEFVDSLWRGVLTQRALLRQGALVGITALYGSSMLHGATYLRFHLANEFRRVAWPFEGVFAFVDQAFETYPLRKIYVESSESEWDLYGHGLRDLLEVEGRLREHVRVKDTYLDHIIAAIWRERWLARRGALLRFSFGSANRTEYDAG